MDDAGKDQGKGQQDCQESLAAFAAADFHGWQGLGDCSPDEVRALYPQQAPGFALGRLGGRQARYFYVQMPGYEDGVAVWYREERVVLLEVRWPQLAGGLDGLLASLGSPPERLDFQWRSLRLRKGLLLYPERGLALFVNPDNQIVLMVTAFAPTTLDDYREGLALELGEVKLQDDSDWL